jgi:hypothetical protein
MSEYVATLTVQRSARGEGDTPVVIAAAAGVTNDFSVSEDDAINRAIDEAVTRVNAALEVKI